MVVGHDDAGRINDEAGAEALHAPFRRWLAGFALTALALATGTVAIEEVLEELLEW